MDWQNYVLIIIAFLLLLSTAIMGMTKFKGEGDDMKWEEPQDNQKDKGVEDKSSEGDDKECSEPDEPKSEDKIEEKVGVDENISHDESVDNDAEK